MSTTEISIFRREGVDIRVVAKQLGVPLAGYEQHLYVVELVDRGVKVGITGQPYTRLRAHMRDVDAYGREIGRIALTAPHSNARTNERSLVALGGIGNHREYIDMRFDAAVEAIRSMAFDRADRAAVAARSAAVTGLFKSMLMGEAS